MELAERLVSLRKQKGWSQEETARALGVSRQSLHKWETGTVVPGTDYLIRLSKLYGLTLDELVNGEVAPRSREPRQVKKLSPWLAPVLAVMILLVGFGWMVRYIDDQPVVRTYDRNFSSVTLLTEENEQFIGRPAHGGRSSIVYVTEIDGVLVEQPLELETIDYFPPNRIITAVADGSMMVPSSIVEAEVKRGTTPALIGGNGAMCIFTQGGGKGWYLEEGDTISWTYHKYAGGYILGIGYIRDGVIYNYEGDPQDREPNGVYQLEAGESGTYYIYYICLSSDPVSLKEGEIKVQ